MRQNPVNGVTHSNTHTGKMFESLITYVLYMRTYTYVLVYNISGIFVHCLRYTLHIYAAIIAIYVRSYLFGYN